ncbi:MAG: hypothetical protein Q9191_003523 [Dirinaria sp. TL-2023a]
MYVLAQSSLNYTANDVQTVVPTKAGNEGAEKCDEILDPNCSGTGLDINLCRQYPEAHFLWFAISHWAHFMNKLHGTFDDSTISLKSLTSTLVKQFFIPQSDPSQLIMAVGILSGIAAAISPAWPSAAVAAASGTFASTPEVDVFNPGIYGALAASAINAVWIQDKVVVIKINDSASDKGDGAACQAFPNRTAYIDGVAYIFVKWAMDGGSEIPFSEFFEHD